MKALVLFELVEDDFDCGNPQVSLIDFPENILGELSIYDATTAEYLLERIERELVIPKMVELKNDD